MDNEIHQPVTQMTSLYQSLPSPDSFRILQLHPGIGAERLICDFVEAELSQKPSYEALSYRWTDPNKENPDLVYCNGFDCPIGSNLYAALIRFRLADVPRALWVDQLCINQAEGPEMAQQLLIMGDIYSKAERVLAWLGPAYDDSDKAMDLFPKLVDRLQAVTRDHENNMTEKGNRAMGLEETIVRVILSLPELEQNSRRALHKLFQRSLFDRVWTLQELALGKNTVIVCGDGEFPFAAFERYNEGIQTDSIGYWDRTHSLLSECQGEDDPEVPLRAINHYQVVWIFKLLDSSAFPLSSARVLTLLRGFECSEADDRVYSILRYLPSTLAQSLAAVKRRSTEALFIDLATFELTKNRSMDFLSAAGMCQHKRWYPSRKDGRTRPTLKLPTWVPDWTYSTATHGLWVLDDDGIRKGGYGPLYEATDRSRGDARLTIVNDTKILRVQGKIFDEIAACVEPYYTPIGSKEHREDENLQVQDTTTTQMMEYCDASENHDEVKEALSFIELWKLQADSCMALAKSCKVYHDDIGRTTACRQTLIGGMFSRTRPVGGGVQDKATNEEANQLFTEWEVALEITHLMKRLPEGSESNEADRLLHSHLLELIGKARNFRYRIWSAFDAMILACKGRRFFTSTKGCMGLAPDIAQVGDKICLISGCCTPFIIRADGPNFSLVGESYVHGVMDGELMADITFEDINLV